MKINYLSKYGTKWLMTKIKGLLNGKVDKVAGKGLSTNDFTTAEKNKLAGIATEANKYTLPAATADTLGGVNTGANITNTDGAISLTKKNVTDARAIAMYLSRIMTEESLQRIGLEFGGRDHSTVIYSHEKISNELKTNTKLQEEIKILKEKICE